ncbi:hypothetical protein EAG_02085 [Camponotus floridanus]|uniref:Uncharacterized protein n=1 Tax=Camponotus floridanus TaxID=104421 RepID=E2B1L7_CAMFO|nr:hypothetical protein EAG_02085 [Camponotus floridanus]
MEIDEILALEFSYYHANLLIKRGRGVGELYVSDVCLRIQRSIRILFLAESYFVREVDSDLHRDGGLIFGFWWHRINYDFVELGKGIANHLYVRLKASVAHLVHEQEQTFPETRAAQSDAVAH